MTGNTRYLLVLLPILIAGAVTIQAGQTIAIGQGGGDTTAVVGQGGRPARDTPPPPTGTSRIRGRLIDASTGAPLRRANVRVSAQDIRVMRATSTDAEGRYEIAGLAAGKYNVSASKSGYVDSSYGQLAPQEPGKPVTVGDRQNVDRIDLSLLRGGVITGRVLDEFGEPVVDAMVVPARMTYLPGGRRAMPSGRASTTNDIGEFRLFGLAPGQYFVSATVRPQNFAFAFAGDVAAPLPAENAERTGYLPTFYPSAASIGEAQPLTVGAGETLPEVAITIIPTRTSTITGTVADVGGARGRQGRVAVVPLNNDNLPMMGGNGGPIRPDGSFVLTGITPGRYLLRAENGGGGRGGRGGDASIAVATVTVNGDDLSGVRLELLQPVAIAGRLVIDPAASSSLRPGTIRLVVAPATGGDPRGPSVPGPAPVVQNDFSFEVRVYPDTPLIVRPVGLPPGWMVRAVHMNGVDVTDGFTVASNSNVTIDISLSDRAPSIAGQVTDGRGQTVTAYSVIAFPQDRERWNNLGSGHGGIARPDNQNRFTFRTLLPGRYYFLAVDHVDPNQWMDPAFLERARASATRADLAEGDVKTLDLTLASVR